MEIERKYLIRMPDQARLARDASEVWDIVQTYLRDGADGATRRVRRILCGGDARYVFTQKHFVSAMSNREEEAEVSEAAYARLLQEANPALKPIEKRRYRIPYAGQLLEVDLYSFWTDRATLEIELADEAQPVKIPEWIEIVREVTEDRRYKNRSLAAHVPMEALK